MIKFESVTFSYSSSDESVLKRVNLEIDKGEFVLVVGATGSGKTTLLKTINRLAPSFTGGSFSGKIFVDEIEVTNKKTNELAELIGYVGQNPTESFVTETVREELAYGMEQLGVSPAFMAKRVEQIAKLVDIEKLLDAKLDEISGGEQQRVAIGAALAAGQKLLLLDEPTSALDAEIASKTMSLLRRLSKDEKITVILTEHRVERALEFLDSIVIVHKDGSVVKKPASVAFQEFRIQPAIIALGKKMGWDPLETKLSKAQARWNVSARELPITVKPRRQFASTSDRKLIASSKDICVTFGNIRALSKLNLSLESSQITAIMGKNGSGKSTALWALQGSKPSQAASVTGQMLIVGFDPAGMDAEDRLSCVAMVPQKASDLLFLNTLGKELAESDSFSQSQQGTTAKTFENLIGRIDPGIHPRDLSNGQQIALVLASQLNKDAPLILLDEPTRGLDYSAKQHLAEALVSLKQAGKAIVIASHDVEFVADVCDRVLVLEKGFVIAEGTPEELFLPGTEYATQIAEITQIPGLVNLQQIEVNNEG